jgi:CO/xanthine dehydrogenase FAD-binding subunit
MDLNTIDEIQRPISADSVKNWKPGYAWLAGGTWLFSEPQVGTHTLIDLESFQWPALTSSPEGLEIAGTCKIVELDRFVAPPDWQAVPLFRECCRAFLASFKIWNAATVGGNVCMTLPAGPMISLTAALEGNCTLWPREGEPRNVATIDFVTGNHQNVLAPGELLRSIFLPAAALRKKYAFRQFSLIHLGRSSALLIGTLCPDRGTFLLTITAATSRPLQFRFDSMPSAAELKRTLDHGVPFELYFDDTNGSPSHRQHLSYYYAEEIRQELSVVRG